jgi:hypothetical protein
MKLSIAFVAQPLSKLTKIATDKNPFFFILI